MSILSLIKNTFVNFEGLMEHLRVTWFVFPRQNIHPVLDMAKITGDVYFHIEMRKVGSPIDRHFLFRQAKNGYWRELTKGVEALKVWSFINGEWEWEDRSGNRNRMSNDGFLIKQETYKQRKFKELMYK